MKDYQYFDRVERIFREINNSIVEGSLVLTLSLKKLPVVLSRLTALSGLLVICLFTTIFVNLNLNIFVSVYIELSF